MSAFSNFVGQAFGGSTSTAQANPGIGGLLQQLIPPSPTDILKTVGWIVLAVTGLIAIFAIIYLLTRRGKGARNVKR